MTLQIDHKDLEKMIAVDDKVLIRPKFPNEKTKSGLFSPLGLHESEPVHSGYVLKVGSGYPIPSFSEEAPYLNKRDVMSFFLNYRCEPACLPPVRPAGTGRQSVDYEIVFNSEKDILVPHSAILLLIRDEGLFE